MPRECTEEICRFLATGEYDMVHAVWPGRHALERIHAGEAALRAALAHALSRRTKGLTFSSMPADFDAGRFVLVIGPEQAKRVEGAQNPRDE